MSATGGPRTYDPKRSIYVEYVHYTDCECEICTNPDDYRNRLMIQHDFEPLSAGTLSHRRIHRKAASTPPITGNEGEGS